MYSIYLDNELFLKNAECEIETTQGFKKFKKISKSLLFEKMFLKIKSKMNPKFKIERNKKYNILLKEQISYKYPKNMIFYKCKLLNNIDFYEFRVFFDDIKKAYGFINLNEVVT